MSKTDEPRMVHESTSKEKNKIVGRNKDSKPNKSGISNSNCVWVAETPLLVMELMQLCQHSHVT